MGVVDPKQYLGSVIRGSVESTRHKPQLIAYHGIQQWFVSIDVIRFAMTLLVAWAGVDTHGIA